MWAALVVSGPHYTISCLRVTGEIVIFSAALPPASPESSNSKGRGTSVPRPCAFVIGCLLPSAVLSASVCVAGMEQLVGPLTAGLVQIVLIDLLDQRALVALPQGHLLVLLVQGAGPHSGHTAEIADHRGLEGLAAAVHAPAWAGHDLDEVIGPLSASDVLQHLARVGRSAEDAHPDSPACLRSHRPPP